MSRDGEWTDASVLVAVTRMLKRDILVVTISPKGTGTKLTNGLLVILN